MNLLSCRRLSLQCVSLIWHIPQPLLLKRMICDGLDGRLVKVAAAGLPPRRFLLRSLRSCFSELMKAVCFPANLFFRCYSQILFFSLFISSGLERAVSSECVWRRRRV